MLAHPAPEGAGKAGANAAATASAGPPSPSKWSSATGVSGGGGLSHHHHPHHLGGGALPGSAFAPHAPAADASPDTSCKEDDFFCDENDGLLHYPSDRHPHDARPPLGPSSAAAAAAAAQALLLVGGGGAGAAATASAALLHRTGSFTSRMTPLPKEHPHHHEQQQQQPRAAPDAPRWRPRGDQGLACPAAAQAQQQQQQLAVPPSAAEAADVDHQDGLACGAAPLLSCCEALDFIGGGTGVTPLPLAAAVAVVAPGEAAAPATAKAPAASAGPSPLLPSPAAAAAACAAPAGAGFNADVVLQLRNDLLREAELRPSPDCLDAHGPDHHRIPPPAPGAAAAALGAPPAAAAAGGDTFVTPQMRAVVVSWLSEVAAEFALQQETLFSAASLLDRFLSSTDAVPRGMLQLAAVAACMLACKQDEAGGASPAVEELVDVAAGCFRREDLLRMERILLDALGWRVRAPTAYTFLHLIGQALPSGLQPAAAALACYLAELSLLDYASLAAPPSAVAGAALLLAQASTAGGEVQWREVSELTGHAAGDLARLAAHLLGLQQQAEREAAAATASIGGGAADDAAGAAAGSGAPSAFVREKYAAPAWLCASVARPPLEAFGPPPPSHALLQ